MKLIIEGDEAQIATVMEALKVAKTLIEERDFFKRQVDIFVQDRRARGLPDYVKPPLGKPPAFEHTFDWSHLARDEASLRGGSK